MKRFKYTSSNAEISQYFKNRCSFANMLPQIFLKIGEKMKKRF